MRLKLAQYSSIAPWIVSRLDLADVADSPGILDLIDAAARESAKVAQAAGINLDPDETAQSMRHIFESNKKRTPKLRPSLLVDLDKGRPMELEDLVGVIVHKGAELGVETPIISTCYELLKPYANGSS